MKTLNYYQHGDVLIKEVKEIPKDVKELKTNTVREGEHTGHHHSIVAGQFQLMQDAMSIMYLQCITACILKHQEHNKIEIPKGMYVVEAVREFDPFENEIREVQD